MNYDHLIEFATQRELDYLDAVKANGSHRKAAAAVGCNRSTIDAAIVRLKLRAAQVLITEHSSTERQPEGFSIAGTTTLNRDGKQVMQWVRSKPDADHQLRVMRETINSLCSEVPKEELVDEPRHELEENLCNLYTFTDYHLGMMAWHKEGGADWDLKIASSLLWDSFKRMVDASPSSETCVLNIQGDFLHSDGLVPLTPAHKHVLDVAGRFSQIVDAAIHILKRLIKYALAKHMHVHLIIVEGNHDEASSMWLRKMFAHMFEDEPRLSVNDSELPYYAYQFGDVMMAFHHGHKAKNEELPGIFAAQFSKMWGNTSYRVCHTGHRHHLDEKEFAGMTVIQHPTLSARDSHTSRGGWCSERAAMAITYHKSVGQYGRTYVSPNMP